MRKTLFILFSIFYFPSISFSQDMHFSQFYSAPLELNPAFTGLFNGNIRGAMNYRNQWESFAPFTTFAGSVDMNIGQNFLDNDLIGVGAHFISDVAGSSEFSTTQTSLSFSYIQALGNRFSRSYLSVGFEGGFAQRSINAANLTFGNQYNGYSYDANLATGESMGFDNFSYLDFSGGIAYLFVPKEGFNFYSGVAIHHLNQPDQSFSNIGDNLYMRTSANVGAQFPLTENFDLVPAILVQMQGPHYEFVLGTNMKYYMYTKASNETALSFGAWHRSGIDQFSAIKSDAVIVTMRYDIFGLSAGLSYDLNISTLREASNAFGGPEISLIYVAPLPHRDRKVDCPKF